MSYILESLKKSDQERHASQPSIDVAEANMALHDGQVAAVDKETSYFTTGLLVLSILFCVLVFLIAYSYWLPMNDESNRFQSPLASIDPPALQAVEPSLGLLNDVQQPPLSDESEKPLSPIKNDLLSDAEKNDRPLIKKEKIAHVSPAINTLYQQATLEEKTSIDILYENNTFLEEESVPVKEAITKNVDNQDKAAKSNEKASLVIPSVFSLDRQLQHSIPAINYGAHIYASDNKSGFVILDGVKRRAGEKMNSGVYIEKINEDLVVLSFRGVIFSLPAMKNWNP
jgi:hypothetical protein